MDCLNESMLLSVYEGINCRLAESTTPTPRNDLGIAAPANMQKHYLDAVLWTTNVNVVAIAILAIVVVWPTIVYIIAGSASQ